MRTFILLLMLSLTVTFCTQQINEPVQVNDTPGQLSLTLSMAKAPSEVAGISGTLIKDQDTVKFDFEIKDGYAKATVEDLEPGDWYLQVDAYNGESKVIYSGSTSVTVEPGVVTPVYLNLDPTTGSLEIIVTWGGVKPSMMLMMAKNKDLEWRILMMDINGKHLEDLIDGRYPIWIGKQRNKFIFLRGRDELCEFDVNRRQVSVINTLTVNANFLFYSSSLNRILFDYKHFGDYSLSWHLASIDLTGRDFQQITDGEFWQKYPNTPMNSDWIYYHTALEKGKKQINRIKPDGSGEETVIVDENYNEFPAFSLDGQKMVYTRMSVDSTFMGVVIRDLSSSNETVIDVSELGQPTYPAFSSDGLYVVFSIITGPTHLDRQLFRAKSDGSELTQITFGNDYYWYARPLFW
ncbi:MAG: hypothetical protein GXO77_03440 [Calditrichaeota bacterium]|nr:hypothetical protein [Calditrichota bacterium]